MQVSTAGTANRCSNYHTNAKDSAESKQINAADSSLTTEKAEKSNTEILSYYDDGVDYNHGDVDMAKELQYLRKKVNQAVNQLFHKNGIQVPKETTLTFTIDPYDRKLHVSGLGDKDMAARIESVLNRGENSNNLFYHICCSSSGMGIASNQRTQEKDEKCHLFNLVKNNTGYDLRDCISRNGTFYAPDGTDVIKEFMKGKNIPAEFRTYATSEYEPGLRKLAAEGFQNSEDLILQIDYKDGCLYDIGQNKGFGPGQTKWIDDLVSKYGDKLFIKPQKEYTFQSKTPAIRTLLQSYGIPKNMNFTISFSPKNDYVLFNGIDDIDMYGKLMFIFYQPSSMRMLHNLVQQDIHIREQEALRHLDVSV